MKKFIGMIVRPFTSLAISMLNASYKIKIIGDAIPKQDRYYAYADRMDDAQRKIKGSMSIEDLNSVWEGICENDEFTSKDLSWLVKNHFQPRVLLVRKAKPHKHLQ